MKPEDIESEFNACQHRDYCRQVRQTLASDDLLYYKRFTALMMDGWDVDTTLLYDEEGVDGWEWRDHEGNEYCVIGGHDETPEMTEEIELLADEIIARLKI